MTTETHLASIRAGGDLIVDLIRFDTTPTTWKVQAFDNTGNPLIAFGAFVDEQQAFAMLPHLVTLAREAYGPGGIRHSNDFNLVAWRVHTDDGRYWEWAGDDTVNQLDMKPDLGVPTGDPVPTNNVRVNGVDRCPCGCKYWVNDRCIDCGNTTPEED